MKYQIPWAPLVVGLILVSCGDPPLSASREDTSLTDVSHDTAKMDRPNLLLITVDTTRADHLGCYGYEKVRTPNMDALAREGVLFEEAFSTQPVTLPAHCSIHTGKYPFRHGVRDNNIYELAEENQTLAEVLKENGYITTAFVASFILNRRFGLSQGFHYYNDRFVKPKQKGRLPVDRRASEVSFLATEWLTEMRDELTERPFFLWLHYYDPHADYSPPHPYKTAYGNPYDGEIAYMDDWLGYFFDELKKIGKWDDTMVVLVGDHGEGFGDHGESTHGMFIYRATTHVPLIIRFARSENAGTRVPYRVSQVDIFPTVLQTMKLKGTDTLDGRALQPLIFKKEKEHRDAYSEVFIPRTFNWSELTGLRTRNEFFVQAPTPEFYHLNRDPYEKVNRYTAETDAALQVSRQLTEMVEAAKPVQSKSVALSDEMEDRLAQLGYFVAADGPFQPEQKERPDPKDRVVIFNLQQDANSLIEQGREEEALAAYNKLVHDDPLNPRFLMELANLHVTRQNFTVAEKLYLRAEALDSDNSRLLTLMGNMYRLWQKPTAAVRRYKQALDLNADDFLANFHLATVLMAQNEYATAKHYLQKAVAVRGDAAVYNNLGYIAIQVDGQYQTGIRYLKKAVHSAVNKAPYLYSLGLAYREHNRLSEARTALEQAVELVPENADYLTALEAVYRVLGETENSKRLLQRLDVLRTR